MLWLRFVFSGAEWFQAEKLADLRRSAWQRCSADYNKNRGIDSQIEGTFFTAVAAAFTTERHSYGQGVNGQNPWSNYFSSALHGSSADGKGVSGYHSVFCFSEQLLHSFLSLSSCLGNSQSRGGWDVVEGNVQKESFHRAPFLHEKRIEIRQVVRSKQSFKVLFSQTQCT